MTGRATTRFNEEVAYDHRFVAYAAGMAASFLERLATGRRLDVDEIDWLYRTTGHSTSCPHTHGELCQQLVDDYALQQVTQRLKS